MPDTSLAGGTSDWKANAPTVQIVLEKPLHITGWVTAATNPDGDNVGFWAASNSVLPEWAYTITVVP